MAKLIIIHGFLASGKSTFARNLAARCTNSVIYNADEVCEIIFSEYDLANAWDDCFEQTLNQLFRKAQVDLANGCDVILDFGFWSRQERDTARKIANMEKADFEHYYLEVSDGEAMNRLKQRKDVYAQKNLRNYFFLKKRFSPPHTDESHISLNQ